jgi:hypothetical protein
MIVPHPGSFASNSAPMGPRATLEFEAVVKHAVRDRVWKATIHGSDGIWPGEVGVLS